MNSAEIQGQGPGESQGPWGEPNEDEMCVLKPHFTAYPAIFALGSACYGLVCGLCQRKPGENATSGLHNVE